MEGAAENARAADAAAATRGKDEPRTPARGSGSSGALVEEAARVAATLNEKLPPLSQETHAPDNYTGHARRQEARREDAAFDAPAAQQFAREESVGESASAAETPGAEGEPRGQVGRRAATVGASVGENLRPRVEKLREASTGVLDEASDDPGLRFVIIAGALFLLFLFIFLFSYILG